MGFEPLHEPFWHVSVCVHALPSVHALPFALFGLLHTPLAGSQMPATWHWSSGVHTTGLLPLHVPLWQVSVCVHALLSSHVLPSAFAGLLQTPLAGLHTPGSWH